MNALSIILRFVAISLYFVICFDINAKESSSKHREIPQNIPTLYKKGTLDVVKHRMKNNLHLFSSHFSTSAKQTHTYYLTTNEQGKFQWALKLRMSNNLPIFCSQNDIIDTEKETILVLSIPKGVILYVNDKAINSQKETNVLLIVNNKGKIQQNIKFTSQSFNPEFGLVVSQSNSINNFVCLVEKRNSLLLDNKLFGEKDGLYLLRFSKEKSSGLYVVDKQNKIGSLLVDNQKHNNSLVGIRLYLSNSNHTMLYSNIPNKFVTIESTNGLTSLHENVFPNKKYPKEVEKKFLIVLMYWYNSSFRLLGANLVPGTINGLTENKESNFIVLNIPTIIKKKDSLYTELKNSVINNVKLIEPFRILLDSVSYTMDFLRSQDNYQTNKLVTYIRYVYDSQLLKHYKILRRYSNEKLEDVISMEEPLIDSKSVISKNGKYIHTMVAVPKKSQKSNDVFFKEYTILIKHEDMFKIEKNKVAEKK